MSKVYKGRQKLSFEQAGQYYSFAYKIGVEHGKFEEQLRILDILTFAELDKQKLTQIRNSKVATNARVLHKRAG